jgi:hypothetical protein
VSPEAQRRLDRMSKAPLAWSRPKPSAPRQDRAGAKPQAERRAPRQPVMGEGIFKGLLLRESKRMERSDRSFALLLVSLDAVVGEDPLIVWGSVVEALSAAKRDTDVVGWFERGAVIGVVLTEIESRDAALVCGIEARVRQELAKRLEERAASSVSIRLYAHPDLKRVGDEEAASADPLLRAIRPRDRRGETYSAVKRALDVVGRFALASRRSRSGCSSSAPCSQAPIPRCTRSS